MSLATNLPSLPRRPHLEEPDLNGIAETPDSLVGWDSDDGLDSPEDDINYQQREIDALRIAADNLRQKHDKEVAKLKQTMQRMTREFDEKIAAAVQQMASFRRQSYLNLMEVSAMKAELHEINVELAALKEQPSAVPPPVAGDEEGPTRLHIPSPPASPAREFAEHTTCDAEIAALKEELASVREEMSALAVPRGQVKRLQSELDSVKSELASVSRAIDLSTVEGVAALSEEEQRRRHRSHRAHRSHRSDRREHRSREERTSASLADRDWTKKEYDSKQVLFVQSAVRRWLARRRANELRVAGMEKQEFEAAVKVQSVVRAWLGKRKYETLSQYRGQNLALVRAQAVIRGRLAQIRFRKLVRRGEVAKEIFDSEQSYVDGLDTLLEVFLLPLRRLVDTKDPPCSREDIRSVFSYVEVIYNTNAMLLDSLGKRVGEQWHDGQRVGDIFLKMVDFLKAYTQYVNNYPTALRVLMECRKRPKFAAWLESAEAEPRCGGLKLLSFLILPIQRIPRYVLLLQDFSKNTSQLHEDYADVMQALEKVKEVADYVNEKKREAEEQQKVLEVQESLVGRGDRDLVQIGRSFVREGALIDVANKCKEHYLFLFTDAVLITTRKKNGKFRFAQLIELDVQSKVASVTDTEVVKHAFVLVHGAKVRLLWGCHSSEERKEWLDAFGGVLVAQLEKALSFSQSLVNVEAYSQLVDGDSTTMDAPPGRRTAGAPALSAQTASSRRIRTASVSIMRA